MYAVSANFLDLLGSNLTQFVIPVYQRVYSWDEKECRDLWNDVMRAGRTGQPHFIGSFLYTPEAASSATSIKRWLLIDGQQRMTTLSLMLSAFLDYIEEDESRASFLTDVKPRSLRRKYLFNDDDYIGEARYRLVLSQDDRETLHALVSNQPLPDIYSRKLVENRQFFADRVRGVGFDPAVLWAGLNSLLIIDTSLDGIKDNAQLIFESMNSKGKPLTPIDLIRNFILMSLPSQQQAQLYNNWWRPIEQTFGSENERDFNAFIWYWLWLKVPARRPREDEAYEEFKGYVQDEHRDEDPQGLLAELRDYARRYACMFMGREKDVDLRERFDRIASLDVKPIRPLMLSLYTLWETTDRLSKDAFIRLCDYVESFLFRRSVVGRFTTGLNNFFAGMYRELETCADPEEYVTAMLLVHSHGMTAYFPTDDDFSEQLRSRDLYHRFSKSRYYLERLENSAHPKQPIPTDLYQIEHVMPQKVDSSPEWREMLGADWQDVHDRLCNTLGNLTLTGYNQEYSNHSFKDKLDLKPGGLRMSFLHLNETIVDHAVWDEKAIIDRAETLAKEALQAWPYPSLEESVVDKYRPKKERKPDAGWTLEDNHPAFMPGGECHALFGMLCSVIEDERPDWEQYVAKYYVGFRTGGSKLRIAIQERVSNGSLAIALPKSVDELIDPEGIAQDKRAAKGFGPGCPTRVDLRKAEDIDAVMRLVVQC
ncbi:MAG: DUF262 domain-containing protein [Coriobacteriales bacterium]|nr:DUF262 domain-containing protein [Coriobacteriales bacterium]